MNILLVGDFRPAANYGSIATTECLLNLIYPLLSERDELRIIDRRSYDRPTPEDGFHDETVGSLRKVARKIVPLRIRLMLRHKRIPEGYDLDEYRAHEPAPFLYREFEDYSKQMLNGGV